MSDALSIEQNNKIRVALGLKPLPVPGSNANATAGPVFKEPAKEEDDDSDSSEEEPGSTLESRQAEASENWRKLHEQGEAKKRREERNAAVRKAREAAQKNVKLEGSTLGESGDVDVDTKTWLLQSKKKQKKIEKGRAQKLAQELEEREQQPEYTAADLAGVRVGHEAGEFAGGEDHILTLKDTAVDADEEEEGDELENLELRDQEKVQERVESKKRKPAYDPTQESTGILSQYDEEIEGKKRKRFTLDAQGSTAEDRDAKRQEVSGKLDKNIVSLDIAPEQAPVSDYMDIGEIKVKKPKKKSKAARQKPVEDDDMFSNTGPATNMEVDSGINGNGEAPAGPRKSTADEATFIDDEDLQASLAMQRRAAFKNRKKTRPEDIARQLREEEFQAPTEPEGEESQDNAGLVIDETSEFISNLQRPTIPEHTEKRARTAKEEASPKEEPEFKQEEDEEDVDMERTLDGIEDEEDLKERIKREETAQPEQQISGTGLEEESTLDQGLGSTLAMLKQRGLVEASSNAQHNTLLRDRKLFLQEKHQLESEAEKRARQQRERDRASGKLDRMTAREREEYARWENKQRDQQDARHMAETFNRDYKPDIQLKYVDEFGRLMNQKEAFKHLSHQFHGKGSGKMKTEKRLKKIEEADKREAMSTLDSSQHTGMNNAMGATARKNRQAGVRLG